MATDLMGNFIPQAQAQEPTKKQFDVRGARDAGYSDEEIATEIAKREGLDPQVVFANQDPTDYIYQHLKNTTTPDEDQGIGFGEGATYLGMGILGTAAIGTIGLVGRELIRGRSEKKQVAEKKAFAANEAVRKSISDLSLDPDNYQGLRDAGLSHNEALKMMQEAQPKPQAQPSVTVEAAPATAYSPTGADAVKNLGLDPVRYTQLMNQGYTHPQALDLLQKEKAALNPVAPPVAPEAPAPVSENRPFANAAYAQEGIDVAKYNALRSDGVSDAEARRLASPPQEPIAPPVDPKEIRRQQYLDQGFIVDAEKEAAKLGLINPNPTTSMDEVRARQEENRLRGKGFVPDVDKQAADAGLRRPFEGGTGSSVERNRQLQLSGDYIPDLTAEARQVGLKPMEPEERAIYEKAIVEGKTPQEAGALAVEVSGKINHHYTTEAVKFVPATEAKSAMLIAIRTDPTMSTEQKRIAAEAILDLSDEVVANRLRGNVDKYFYGPGARQDIVMPGQTMGQSVPPQAAPSAPPVQSGTAQSAAPISPAPTPEQAGAYERAQGLTRPVEQQPEMDMFREAESPVAPPNERVVPNPETNPIGANKLAGAPKVEEFPISQLQLSKEVPQFKTGAGKGGVVQPLEGKYERVPTEPIQVWQRNNGAFEVISGRHRFDLAKRNKENTIPVQIHSEAEGFTREMAMRLDAESNIRQGQGKMVDYIDALRNMTPGEAESKGLLSRAFGKNAQTVAQGGTDNLIANLRNDVITESTATEIARSFPKNEQVQNLVLDQILGKGKSPVAAIEIGNALKAQAFEAGQMQQGGDLFGFDDTMAKQAVKIAKVAQEEKAAITARLSAMTGAAKNPKLAKQEGIDIKDEAAVKARIAELKAEKAKLDNWQSDPATRARIMAKASGEAGFATVEALSAPYKAVGRGIAKTAEVGAKGLGAYGILDAAVGGLPIDIIEPLLAGEMPRITREFDVVRDRNAPTGTRSKEEIMGEFAKYKKALDPRTWEFNENTKEGIARIKKFLQPSPPPALPGRNQPSAPPLQ